MYSIQLYVQYFGKNTVNTVILDVVQLKYSKKKIGFFFFLNYKTWEPAVSVSLFVAVSLWHAEQLLFSCVCLKVRICNYVECHMLHFTCHMLYVTCLCWSSAHTEQLLFSCVSSKVSICKGDGIYAELGAEPIFITSIFFFLLIIGTESGNGCSTAHEWSWKDFLLTSTWSLKPCSEAPPWRAPWRAPPPPGNQSPCFWASCWC